MFKTCRELVLFVSLAVSVVIPTCLLWGSPGPTFPCCNFTTPAHADCTNDESTHCGDSENQGDCGTSFTSLGGRGPFACENALYSPDHCESSSATQACYTYQDCIWIDGFCFSVPPVNFVESQIMTSATCVLCPRGGDDEEDENGPDE